MVQLDRDGVLTLSIMIDTEAPILTQVEDGVNSF